MSRLEKIEKAVVEGYQKIENGVVDGYKKIEDGFVGKYLVREGESVEEAKMRLAKEQERKNIHVEIPDSKEIVKKNLEASLNAGKRNM